MRHKKGFLMAGVLFLITCMLMNTMSSCSMMAQSIGSMISGTTYPSDDPFGMIGHDPHELAAFLSAVLQGYTQQSAQAELARVFAAQYQLTLTEIRYRTGTVEIRPPQKKSPPTF